MNQKSQQIKSLWCSKVSEWELHPQQANGKIITLFSSASATGKTTLALNLATWLKQGGAQTIVLDMDLQFGDVCNYLKLEPQYSIYDYQKALKKTGVVSVKPFLATNPQIPDILPAPFDIAEAYNMEPATLTKLLSALKSTYDYIFVDMATGFTDINLEILDMADLICFVGLVDFLPTVKNMKSAHDTLLELGIAGEKIRLVLNRNNAKTDIALNDVEALLGQRFYHTLPNDFAQSAAAIQKGLPVLLTAPRSALTAEIGALAEKLTGRSNEEKKAKPAGVKKWFSGLLKE